MADLLRIARAEFVRNGYRATTMVGIAAAAGLTKRTLYSWHGDKEALFRACVIEGARRFPLPDIGVGDDLRSALRTYAAALIRELNADNSFGMGLLFLREARDFPELVATVRRGHMLYVVEPLAAHLRSHGLEEADSVEQTRLLVAMMLAPVHNALLLGDPRPDEAAIERHAESCVDLFLGKDRHTRQPSDRC